MAFTFVYLICVVSLQVVCSYNVILSWAGSGHDGDDPVLTTQARHSPCARLIATPFFYSKNRWNEHILIS